MITFNEAPIYLETPNGKGTLEDIIITDLGYVQIRVKYQSDIFDDCATYVKYTISKLEELLNGSSLKLIKEQEVSEVNE